MQRNFLQGGGILKKKTNLVKWSTVCSSKNIGGLGIRNISTFNRVLLGKWNWEVWYGRKLNMEEVILLKYGVEERGWFSKCFKGSYEIELLKQIRMEVSHLKNNISSVQARVKESNSRRFLGVLISHMCDIPHSLCDGRVSKCYGGRIMGTW